MTNRSNARTPARDAGFTLIELMITVVIAAILVGVAMPSYQAQVRKSRRTDARNALLDMASREEKFLSVNNSYSQLPTDVGYTGAAWPVTVSNGYYNVTVNVPDPGYGGNGPSYIVTAAAIGIQASDAACATFTINQIGKQTAATSAAVDNSTTCWGS